MMKRIGVFGGSFNPVHIGHMIVADYMAQFAGFDEVWLTLSPLNPFKASDSSLLPDVERLSMLHIAVGDSSRLRVCDVEIGLPRPSYTWLTLDTLASVNPDCSFSIIVGSDNWASFDRWSRAEYILRQYGVTVYPRPGYKVSDAREGMRLVNAPMVEISSTFIRDSIEAGRDMTYFLPPGVMKYIHDKQLYRKI